MTSDLDLDDLGQYFTIGKYRNTGIKSFVTVFSETTGPISTGPHMDKRPMVPYRVSPFGGDWSTVTLTLGQNAFFQYIYV